MFLQTMQLADATESSNLRLIKDSFHEIVTQICRLTNNSNDLPDREEMCSEDGILLAKARVLSILDEIRKKLNKTRSNNDMLKAQKDSLQERIKTLELNLKEKEAIIESITIEKTKRFERESTRLNQDLDLILLGDSDDDYSV
ncbi:hypothetical protein Ciccas_010641 [Cichlidogyrus casuarinus]|uniref:Uncharacterized protein n=1 Tax=Cichlidogyrus casuarinus TaxID=1844966 RepID=A0ABD2PTK1_9PLAT